MKGKKKQPEKSPSPRGRIDRFLVPKLTTPADRKTDAHCNGPPPRRQEASPPAAAAAAHQPGASQFRSDASSARRKLDFESDVDSKPPARQKTAHKRQKTSVQSSIKQAFKAEELVKNDIVLPDSPYGNARDYPDPASAAADHRVTELQNLRDMIQVVPHTSLPSQLPLNEEQLTVVGYPPSVTVSVRAGAGSGKTHTLVQRALYLTRQYDIEANRILMVTFSNKATEEMKERIHSVFAAGDSSDKYTGMPVIKTFHSLAFSNICRYWKVCGLSRPPTVLGTKAQERALMKRAIGENLSNLRLERCRVILWKKESRPDEVSWKDVVDRFKTRSSAKYDELYDSADKKAKKLMPSKKGQQKMTAEEVQALHEEVKQARKSYLQVECYLELLQRARAKATKGREPGNKKGGKEGCDLERRWNDGKQQCDLLLDMIRKARLGNHKKEEYIEEDAKVWSLYEKLQLETGSIDFDNMLLLFTKKVMGNVKLAERIRSLYDHIIVDEYQDNSQVQASMLNHIVQHSSLTVVGDDDQCIYQFRGASPGNFERLKADFSEERQVGFQEVTLVENHRSSANILSVADVFLRGDTKRHQKELRPTRSAGLPVEVWI